MNGDERKLLEARLADCVRLGEKRPAFLGFLELSERAEAEAYLRRARAFFPIIWRQTRRFSRFSG